MNRYLIILLVVAFTIVSLSPAISYADLFSQTIGDDDNFGWAPGVPSSFGWDNRSLEEQNANNGAQYTDWDGVVYQKQFIFDFGTAIVDIVQANIEMNAYDIEDAQGDHIDIQLNIEGYDVPGAFDDVDLRFTSGIISFDLLNLLGLDALEDICSDGVVTVDFLNAGSYQEFYALDWVSLNIEGSPPDSGTFCKGLADYDGDVDADDVEEFLKHFGRFEFNNPCPPDGPAPVAKTGQTVSHYPGDDGDSQRGVASPDPRFTDNEDGTVTDNLTGLMWTKNVHLIPDDNILWSDALAACDTLDYADHDDWRLPNIRELLSLIDYGEYVPCLPEGHPFTGVLNYRFWSSTIEEMSRDYPEVWVQTVAFDHGRVSVWAENTEGKHCWPVRGGH